MNLYVARAAKLRTTFCRGNHVLFKYNCALIPLDFVGHTQSLSRVQLFVTSWTIAQQTLLSFTVSQSLLKFISTELLMLSNHLILCHLLLLLPSIFPRIRVFSSESALRIRWPKYWIFSFSISPASEYSGLISFRIDWFDLLAVQGIIKSLLQHHSSKALVFQLSAFFMVQLDTFYNFNTICIIQLPASSMIHI